MKNISMNFSGVLFMAFPSLYALFMEGISIPNGGGDVVFSDRFLDPLPDSFYILKTQFLVFQQLLHFRNQVKI